VCQNNEKQLALAIHNYASANEDRLPDWDKYDAGINKRANFYFGRVTRNGRPVRGAVWFINEQNNRRLDAPIEPDGSYRLEGAPAGAVKVTVVAPFMEPPATSANQTKQPPRPAAPLAEADKIMLNPNANQQVSLRDTVLPPDRYANLKTSGLSTTLESGTVNRFDIQLDDE
jgi:hypothetical protein